MNFRTRRSIRKYKDIPVEKEKATPEAIKKINDQVKGEIQRMIDSYHENRVEETLWK